MSVFSERDVRYMLSPVRLSVCLSSVVGNARAPYSADQNFCQCSYAIWYLGHHHRKFYGDRPMGTPPSGELNPRGCKVGGKLVLITYRKSYMSFRLVSKSVTLSDLERRNGRFLRYLSDFGSFQRPLRKSG